MRLHVVALAVFFAIAGCDDDTVAPAPDLATPDDLGVPVGAPLDLAAIDLAGFCAGTRLAGTCAQELFAHFATCFTPMGKCVRSAYAPFDTWSNCATYQHDAETLPAPYHITLYKMYGALCLYRAQFDPPNDTVIQFCAGAGVLGSVSCTLQAPDGGTPAFVRGYQYDTSTGIFTCFDGTKVDVGAAMGGCAELNQLLDADSLCDGSLSQPPYCG